MSGPIGPMTPLVCLICGAHHYDLEANLHRCCSCPSLIPLSLAQMIDDDDLRERVAGLFSGEYSDFEFTYCDPNHPELIELKRPSVNGTSVKLPKAAIVFLKTIEARIRTDIAKELAKFLQLDRRKHSPQLTGLQSRLQLV